MRSTFVRNAGFSGDGHQRHCDHRSGDAVIQSAFHVERLPHSIRHPAIRHDRGAKGRVSWGESRAQK